jgi:DNA-binding transcriptional LysR family regulator
MVKLHQLKIFECVSRHLNVTNAAAELNMSQPGVSSQLKMLEEEYNLKFYNRSNHGISLTPIGREFLEETRPVLAKFEEIERSFKKAVKESRSATLAVGGSNTLSVTVLPEILKVFRARHPDVQLVIKTSDSHSMETNVLNGGVEIALITNPTYFRDCVYEPYKDYESVAFVPPDSSIPDKPMSLQELTTLPLIVRRDSVIVDELRKRGFQPNLVVQCDAPEAVKASVEMGIGVGLLFRGRVIPEIEKGQLRMLDVPEMKDIKIKAFVVFDNREALSSSAMDFLHTLHSSKS